MRVARAVGHVGWWVFVVARLMCEMGLLAVGMPRRYADYNDSLFGVGLGHVDVGWTAYTPLTDRPLSMMTDPIDSTNVIAVVAMVALAVTVIAALAEAVLWRRWLIGVGTVLAPVVGAAVILVALYERAGNPFGGIWLNMLVVFALVLFGVAIREVWSRAIAPRFGILRNRLLRE